MEQGITDKEVGAANKVKRTAVGMKAKARKDALDSKLAALVPNIDPVSLQKSPGTVLTIELQLEWYRKFDEKIPMKSALKNKAQKLLAFIDTVKCLNNGEVKIPEPESEGSDTVDMFNEDIEEELE